MTIMSADGDFAKWQSEMSVFLGEGTRQFTNCNSRAAEDGNVVPTTTVRTGLHQELLLIGQGDSAKAKFISLVAGLRVICANYYLSRVSVIDIRCEPTSSKVGLAATRDLVRNAGFLIPVGEERITEVKNGQIIKFGLAPHELARYMIAKTMNGVPYPDLPYEEAMMDAREAAEFDLALHVYEAMGAVALA